MTYAVEPWDAVALDLTVAPYSVEAWDAVALDFVPGEFITPLPWSAPALSRVYVMPSGRAGTSGRSWLAMLEAANQADDERAGQWGRGIQSDDERALIHSDAKQSDDERAGRWNIASVSQRQRTSPFKETRHSDRDQSGAWAIATVLDRQAYSIPFLVNALYSDRMHGPSWHTVNLTGWLYDDAEERRRLLNTDPNAMSLTLAVFGQGFTPRAWDAQAFNFGWTKPIRPVVPHDVATRLTARQATPRDGAFRLPWGLGSSVWNNWNLPYPVEPEAPEPPPEPDQPTKRVVYLVMNTLQITDILTGTPLDIGEVSLSLDIDSISWKFSGSLYGDGSLALVKPDAGGMKDISVTINGHAWVFTIQTYTSDERFPSHKYRLTGFSRTQYMAAPYAPTATGSNAAQTTAKQAAEAQLLNTGFTLDWPTMGDGTLPDWTIPAKHLAYQDKSPAQVVAQIVKAAGGVMVPKLNADEWTIQPRYKYLPWQWATAPVDAIIYAGMVTARSGQYEPGREFNACYVSGTTSSGVAVDVQRTGSGGTEPMPDVYEELITDSQAAISRGKAELSATGNKVVETLRLLIPENAAAPGILRPGQLVRVTHDDTALDYVGLVLSNAISVTKAGGAAIYQNVTLERNP